MGGLRIGGFRVSLSNSYSSIKNTVSIYLSSSWYLNMSFTVATCC